MVTKAEMHKKMIRTVIAELPLYIRQYSPSDQVLLNDFLNLLNHFEKAENKRTELLERLANYTQKLYRTNIYLQTKFLWFSEIYFQKANVILSVTGFQALSFYEYLAKHLRKSKTSPGVFELVRKITPLTDNAWEELQYKSNMMLTPLSNDQLELIERVLLIIKEQGIQALNPRMIKRKLKNYLSKKSSYNKGLNDFFTILDSNWYLDFHHHAFGLERIFVHLQMKEKPIIETIPFEDPNNMILRFSDIFISKDDSNTYLGNIFIPSQDIDLLIYFLKKKEKEGILKLKKCSLVKTTHRSISLEKYSADKGWVSLNKGQTKEQIDLLMSKAVKNLTAKKSLHYFSPSFNNKWHFSQHQLKSELISLYCNLPLNYTFKNLPLFPSSDNRDQILSNAEKGLLKQLNYNRILNIEWVPQQLRYEFSLDYYWIIAPKYPLSKLVQFSEILPFSVIHFIEDSVIIWAYLTPQLVKWIRIDLKWKVHAILRLFSPQNPKQEWFDAKTMQWKTPLILKP